MLARLAVRHAGPVVPRVEQVVGGTGAAVGHSVHLVGSDQTEVGAGVVGTGIVVLLCFY